MSLNNVVSLQIRSASPQEPEAQEQTPSANQPSENHQETVVQTEARTGASHGFFLAGFGGAGLTDTGHSGGGVRFGYRGSVSLLDNKDLRLRIDPSIGAQIENRGAAYMTPGGEPIASGFTGGGLLLGASLRIVPNILEHRLSIVIPAVNIAVGGFGTAESTTVPLPATCTPDDFGRGECEPNAGPRTANAGTTGLQNFDLGAARGTSGIYLSVGGGLGVGFEILRGDWGNFRAQALFEAGYIYLAPSDGHAFGFPTLGGTLDLSVNLGGNAVEGPAKPETQTRNIADQPPPNEAWNTESVIRSQLPANATIRSVAFDGHDLGGSPYTVPADQMTAGPHTLHVVYDTGDGQERSMDLRFTSTEPRDVGTGGGGYDTEFNNEIQLNQ